MESRFDWLIHHSSARAIAGTAWPSRSNTDPRPCFSWHWKHEPIGSGIPRRICYGQLPDNGIYSNPRAINARSKAWNADSSMMMHVFFGTSLFLSNSMVSLLLQMMVVSWSQRRLSVDPSSSEDDSIAARRL
jgi:hypothetical protein